MEENKSGQEELTEEIIPTPAQPEDAAPIPEAAEETAPIAYPEPETLPQVPETAETPKTGKVAIAAICAVAVLAVLFVLVLMGAKKTDVDTPETTESTEIVQETVVATVPADGNPDDVTCKGTYTGTDTDAQVAADTVVATIGDDQLTNGQLQVYYWGQINSVLGSQTGYMLMAYGYLDYTQSLDTQICIFDESLTWQQYFLERALQSWQADLVLANAAAEGNMELSQEDAQTLSEIAQALEEQAVSSGLADAQALIASVIGSNATVADYTHYCDVNLNANLYYQAQVDALAPTPAELEAYFAENEESYAESGITRDGNYVDVRHILLTVEGGTTDDEGNTTYSDEEWETCRGKAQEVLDAWLAGDKTEDSFATLANERSEDPGSNTVGGLYEDVYEGQMVQPFNDWCFDESRVYGDYDLVQTSYGYHVMFFVGSTPIWQAQAEADWMTQQTNQIIEDLAAANPMTVDYAAITLGNIDLT